MLKRLFLTAFITLAIPMTGQVGMGHAAEIISSVDVSRLAKGMQTPLGKYLTPKDAHEALEKDPDIIFIDVRDPIEIQFVGHAASIDANVPLAIATHKYNPKGKRYHLVSNKNFVAEAEAVIAREGGTKSSPVFFVCRSGGRSAAATRLLAKEGYTNVWNVVSGFEGDKHKETKTRSVNGWRNSGLPWRYDIAPSVAWQGGQ